MGRRTAWSVLQVRLRDLQLLQDRPVGPRRQVAMVAQQRGGATVQANDQMRPLPYALDKRPTAATGEAADGAEEGGAGHRRNIGQKRPNVNRHRTHSSDFIDPALASSGKPVRYPLAADNSA